MKILNALLYIALILFIVGEHIPVISGFAYLELLSGCVIAVISFIKAILCFKAGYRKVGIVWVLIVVLYIVLIVLNLGGIVLQ